MRLAARSVISTTPLRTSAKTTLAECTFAAGEQPDSDQELDVTQPEGAGPERDRRQIQGSRDDDGREHRRDDV